MGREGVKGIQEEFGRKRAGRGKRVGGKVREEKHKERDRKRREKKRKGWRYIRTLKEAVVKKKGEIINMSHKE